jgi:hypothetical protein
VNLWDDTRQVIAEGEVSFSLSPVICKNELSDPQKASIEVRVQGDRLVVCMCGSAACFQVQPLGATLFEATCCAVTVESTGSNAKV